eukprot:6146826-Amphidinium_carterae.2
MSVLQKRLHTTKSAASTSKAINETSTYNTYHDKERRLQACIAPLALWKLHKELNDRDCAPALRLDHNVLAKFAIKSLVIGPFKQIGRPFQMKRSTPSCRCRTWSRQHGKQTGSMMAQRLVGVSAALRFLRAR